MNADEKPVWGIAYHLNKSVICTGDKVILNVDAHNPDDKRFLYIDNVSLKSAKINYDYKVSVVIPPQAKQSLATLIVPIPMDVKGNVELKLCVTTYRVTYKQNSNEVEKFENLGMLVRQGAIKFQVSPVPCYRAFISRSIKPEDKPIVEPIVSLVQDWGFETTTVGINSFVEQHRDPTDKIIEEIVKSDCLIAIATIRDQSAFTGLYTTLQWLHSEVSFAYLSQKPILLITDNAINLQGILGAKKWPIIAFASNEFLKLQYELDAILPSLRQAIGERKTGEFEKFIQGIQNKAKVTGYLTALEQKRFDEGSPEPLSLLAKLGQITK